MSTSVPKDDRQKRCTLVLRPSSRTINTSVSGTHGINQSTKHTNSVVGSHSRKSFSLDGGSKVLEKSVIQTPRQAARVFDEDGNDVTPEPLYQGVAEAVQPKASRLFLNEISSGSASDQTPVTGSFSLPFSRSFFGSSRISSHSTIDSINEEVEDAFSKREIPINFPVADIHKKRETVKEQVTEAMLNEVIHISTSETDNHSLLDITSTVVSVDADDAEAIIKRIDQYAELCRNRMGSEKHVDRSMQTLNEAPKHKQVQSTHVAMVDTGTTVTTWDMHNTLMSPEQDETVCSPEQDTADYAAMHAVDTSRGPEGSVSVDSIASTVLSAASSFREVEPSGNSVNAASDLQLIMLSEKFQHILEVMERTVLGNIYQPKLAAYRQLPVLKDADAPVKPAVLEQYRENPQRPAVDFLWVFSCELTRGRPAGSMAWNKKNPDLLAVGYGESESSNQTPGLVCCWSLKNPLWPERVIHCDCAVTSMDFSSNNPTQLAVGMQDGTIAIYNVHSQDNNCVISSSECPNMHLGPVWQLRWTQPGRSLTGEDKVEALFSVAEDGRVCKWSVCNNGLECLDVMKLKKTGGNKTEKETESVLSAQTPGLCFDFHPTESNIYLVGTWEGLIHRCSCSNNQQFLETYRKHICPVNRLMWSPFCCDVFLSCASDWTIQLWRQDLLHPVLGFTSTRRAVCDVKWSSKWATVFGVVNEEQLEIWDLNSSILDPVIVQPAAPGVKLESLLFASQADCVLVGDSDGQVMVYQLKNLSDRESSQVDILEGIICSAASR